MPFISIEGAELYYESHGEGPALVLAHGMGGNHAIWFQQIDTFARTNRVIVFDQRGFGLSKDLDGRGRSAFVDDLAALLDALGEERVALLGQSMGAGTCIGFAARYPKRVAALAVSSSLHGLIEPDDVKTIMDKARDATANMDLIDRVLGDRTPRERPEMARLYRLINSFNATTRHNVTGSFYPIAPEALAEAGIPTLFIAGHEDKLFPVEAIRLMQERIAGSFLVEVVGAGHSAFFERPGEYNDTLLSLLQMAGHVGKTRPAHSNAAGYTPVAP
ncbi:alpha/beta fold hydrolase [Pseudokordiimonas caeni]|uniref:alpha/beta fold hydrolase n=1 Tax=Pseudokordiimonas caeni TaxID=2997908 RepID=UPI002811D83E|nr:alpha/beta hydrolase [Pseudokordiimonas caeni]